MSDHEKTIRDGADQALSVSKWLRMLTAREYAGGGVLQKTLDQRGEPAWGHAAREVFASLYQFGATPLAEADRRAGSAWCGAVIAQAEALPEWESLKARAARDAWASGLATSSVVDAVAKTVDAPEDDAAEAAREAREAAEAVEALGDDATTEERGECGRRVEKSAERLAAALESDAQAAAEVDSGRVRRALRAAVARASDEIERVSAQMSALGASSVEVHSASRTTAPREQVRAALAASPKLQRIAALAGRLRLAAREKQANKAVHGAEEVCDVKPGADLARLLPSEAMLLASPETEMLLFRKLHERNAQTYELRGRETRVRGPVLIAIDGSGSMSGSREEWSKAVALALADIAARQNRAFGIIHYAGQVSRVDLFPDARAMSFPVLLESLAHFPGGGTVLSHAIERAGEVMAAGAWTRSDLVVVSDGDDYSAPEAARKLAELRKKRGAVAYGIAIASEFPRELASACEDVARITSADLVGATPKLDRLFSI